MFSWFIVTEEQGRKKPFIYSDYFQRGTRYFLWSYRLSKPSFSSSGSMSQKQGKEQKNEGMWRSLKTIEQVWIWSGVTRRFINNIEPFIHYIKHYLILCRTLLCNVFNAIYIQCDKYWVCQVLSNLYIFPFSEEWRQWTDKLRSNKCIIQRLLRRKRKWYSKEFF